MERTYIHTHITAIIERKELFIDIFNRHMNASIYKIMIEINRIFAIINQGIFTHF